MRFLKSYGVLLFCVLQLGVMAQGNGTIARDSVIYFPADKATAPVQLKERGVPESTLLRLRKDETFWYANADLKKKAVQDTKSNSFWQWLFRQHWFYNLLWMLIIGSFLTVLLLFLWKSNIRLFYKTPATIDGLPEETTTSIFSIDFDAALQKAVAAQDFHGAVRLHYLEVLSLLSGSNFIHFKAEYTNSDYLQQLRASVYYQSFKNLTRHFEYAWYGRFALSPTAYEHIAQDFVSFKNSMDF